MWISFLKEIWRATPLTDIPFVCYKLIKTHAYSNYILITL
jgi:hypothetical protein